jgi:hypothetical protein
MDPETESSSLFNLETLKVRADAARAQREARGVSDQVEANQQKEAPPFDQKLVGKWLEVFWPYKVDGKTTKIWASGKVVRIADGLADKRTARCQNFLPAGAILWAWEADPAFNEPAGEQWLHVLLPSKCGMRKCSMRGAMIRAS